VANYFLLLDGIRFLKMRAVLADSWRRRSFDLCRDFCFELMWHAESFDARYHVGEGEPLVKQVVRGVSFDRDIWRALVGELLFYAADEIPEIPTCPDTLSCLLAPNAHGLPIGDRRTLAPIQQVHFGSRSLSFSSTIYRPEHCGFNDRSDVQRLAGYLRSVDPSRWQLSDLHLLRDVPEDERAEELEIARDWFPALRDLYCRADEAKQVIVHEIL
jgi:hypothetical protein